MAIGASLHCVCEDEPKAGAGEAAPPGPAGGFGGNGAADRSTWLCPLLWPAAAVDATAAPPASSSSSTRSELTKLDIRLSDISDGIVATRTGALFPAPAAKEVEVLAVVELPLPEVVLLVLPALIPFVGSSTLRSTPCSTAPSSRTPSSPGSFVVVRNDRDPMRLLSSSNSRSFGRFCSDLCSGRKALDAVSSDILDGRCIVAA
mmetsp:Transcript_13389/g.32808  ORF Transcript_13389/g.32808 Transcript_13389/m.32808 type:complete len:204 (-) Transcript_13389:1644-2255(-)